MFGKWNLSHQTERKSHLSRVRRKKFHLRFISFAQKVGPFFCHLLPNHSSTRICLRLLIALFALVFWAQLLGRRTINRRIKILLIASIATPGCAFTSSRKDSFDDFVSFCLHSSETDPGATCQPVRSIKKSFHFWPPPPSFSMLVSQHCALSGHGRARVEQKTLSNLASEKSWQIVCTLLGSFLPHCGSQMRFFCCHSSLIGAPSTVTRVARVREETFFRSDLRRDLWPASVSIVFLSACSSSTNLPLLPLPCALFLTKFESQAVVFDLLGCETDDKNRTFCVDVFWRTGRGTSVIMAPFVRSHFATCFLVDWSAVAAFAQTGVGDSVDQGQCRFRWLDSDWWLTLGVNFFKNHFFAIQIWGGVDRRSNLCERFPPNHAQPWADLRDEEYGHVFLFQCDWRTKPKVFRQSKGTAVASLSTSVGHQTEFFRTSAYGKSSHSHHHFDVRSPGPTVQVNMG